jgi:hypothetical protein
MAQLLTPVAGDSGDFVHWCPGCEEKHVLPWKRGGWTFNGNMERPTFTPSFLHQWRRMGADGVTPEDARCHYILTDGVLNFCGDSKHALAGKSVPLVPQPTGETEP